jgi:hypothetical protein
MPLFASELIDTILMAVPSDLASRSTVFLPLGPPSVAAKVPRGRKDKEDDGSKKFKKPSPLPLSAAMMLSIAEHITQRFGVVTASEAILRCSTHGHGEGRPHRGRRMIPADTFARALASSLIQPGMPAGPGSVSVNTRKESDELKKMKSFSKIVSDDEEDRDSGLQIRSETEAAACLLQLRKIADQLLLASLRKTLDEVNDVATFGTMSVQEWMNTAPPETTLVAVTVSGTPFLSRHQSFATGLTIGSAFS